MAGPSLLARSGLWRLTRHPLVRTWYRRLKERGCFLAQLDRFVRPTTRLDPPATSAPTETTFEIVSATESSISTLDDTV